MTDLSVNPNGLTTSWPRQRAGPVLKSRPPDQGVPAQVSVTRTSRVGVVVAMVGAGIFITGAGDALARNGHGAPALPLFFAGLMAIFLPCAWLLTNRDAIRRQRMAVSLILGIALLVSYYMRSPLIFDAFDELIHGATVNGFLDGRTLDVHNSILPISDYYPGLELLTVAVKWLTGLPLVLAELVVILAARIVVVLGLFLVIERVTGSTRAGGIGVLVYAANPSFYTFASWDYGPFALAFAVAAVYFLLTSLDGRTALWAGTDNGKGWARLGSNGHPGAFTPSRRAFVLALGSIAALVVTHHLTAWLTAGLLVVWAIGLRIDKQWRSAKLIGVAATVSVVLVAIWSAFVGTRLTSYLNPLLGDAVSGLVTALRDLHGTRQLFHTTAGQGGASLWEIMVMVGAAACWCLLLVPSGLATMKKQVAGRGVLRFLPLVVAAAYPLAMLGSLSTGSSQVGERTTTFIFFGMAIVVGGWLATRVARERGKLEIVGTVLVAGVCFLGGMIFGSGPDVTYVPGPYLVGANQRSVSAPSLAAAEWAAANIPAGSVIATDRQNGALLADIARLTYVTSISGKANASSLLFQRSVDSSEVGLIRRDDIRYILIDRRLATSLPLFGTYVEPGEAPPGTQLTVGELSKFDYLPGVERIYDNGPIQIYDVSALLGTRQDSATAAAGDAGAPDAANYTVASAAVVATILLVFVGFRRRRKWGRPPASRTVIEWIVGGMIGAYVVAAVLIPTRVSPTVIGLCAIAVLLVALGSAGLKRARRQSPVRQEVRVSVSNKDRPSLGVAQWVLAGIGCLGVVLGLVAATEPAEKEWRAPTQLGVHIDGAGQAVVTAQLAVPTTNASLIIFDDGHFLESTQLLATTAMQRVVLPASAANSPLDCLLIESRSSLAVRTDGH